MGAYPLSQLMTRWAISCLFLVLLNNIEYGSGAPQVPLNIHFPRANTQPTNSKTPKRLSSHFHVYRDIDDAEIESRESYRAGVNAFRTNNLGGLQGRHNTNSRLLTPIASVPSSGRGASSVRITKKKLGNLPGKSSHPYTIIPESREFDDDRDFDERFDSLEYDDRKRGSFPFNPNTHNKNKQVLYSVNTNFGIDDDDLFEDVSFEDLLENARRMSLGRRFHPQGIPKQSNATTDPLLRSRVITAPANINSNPFMLHPHSLISTEVDSLEIGDEIDDFVILSPMVQIRNHQKGDEKLSLSNDFMNQYNFVDVQGSTKWGYKTEDQYQDHSLHKSGTMEGKFGWKVPDGPEVNIQYIADDNGYRVISSTGIYQKDTEEVQREKEKHLANIENTKIYHQNLANSMNTGTSKIPIANTGVPLPSDTTSFNGNTQNTKSPNQNLNNQFFVIPDDDDAFIMRNNNPNRNPNGQNTGIPLPNLGVITQDGQGATNLPPKNNVQGSNFGIKNNPPQSSNTGTGIPLPAFNPETTQAVPAVGLTPSKDATQGHSNQEVPQENTSGVTGVPLPSFNVRTDATTTVPSTPSDVTGETTDSATLEPVPEGKGINTGASPESKPSSPIVGIPLPTNINQANLNSQSTISNTAQEGANDNSQFNLGAKSIDNTPQKTSNNIQISTNTGIPLIINKNIKNVIQNEIQKAPEISSGDPEIPEVLSGIPLSTILTSSNISSINGLKNVQNTLPTSPEENIIIANFPNPIGNENSNIAKGDTANDKNTITKPSLNPCLNSKLHPSLRPAHCPEIVNSNNIQTGIPLPTLFNKNASSSKAGTSNNPKDQPIDGDHNLITSTDPSVNQEIASVISILSSLNNKEKGGNVGVPLSGAESQLSLTDVRADERALEKELESDIPVNEPKEKHGKSLRRSTNLHESESQNSFIIVVDTGLFI